MVHLINGSVRYADAVGHVQSASRYTTAEFAYNLALNASRTVPSNVNNTRRSFAFPLRCRQS